MRTCCALRRTGWTGDRGDRAGRGPGRRRNDDANAAFGGTKASGIGRFGGQWAIDEITTDHWVSVQHTPRSFPI